MTEWQLGLIAFREGRFREAIDRLRAASEEREHTVTDSVRFQTLTHLGAALYMLGQPAEAVPVFEDALLLAPSPPPAELTINLSNAYLAAGQRQQAREMLARTVREVPGHVEASLLLQRLDGQPEGDLVSGAILGTSVASVKQFLRTLRFGQTTVSGYDPAHVQWALARLERYIEWQAEQLAVRDTRIEELQASLERYRQMEDTLIENIIKAQQAAAPQRGETTQPAVRLEDAPLPLAADEAAGIPPADLLLPRNQ